MSKATRTAVTHHWSHARRRRKLYKVLRGNHSCTSGNPQASRFVWDLPKHGKPGKWMHVDGPLRMCCNGLHVTSDPAGWWYGGANAVFEVEIKGARKGLGDKLACRSVRLLRKLTLHELRKLGIKP